MSVVTDRVERAEAFIRLPHSWCGASLDAILRVAGAAEELGFDGVSVQDHILSGPDIAPCGHRHLEDDRLVFEPLATLSFVAARTTRVKLLTGVLVLPFRHPVSVAKAGATIDVLSGGRLILGVGVGAPTKRTTDGIQNLAPHSDIASRESALFDLPGTRAQVMDESLAALDRLWTDDEASYHGELFRFDGVDMRPRPVQRPRPPIWIGGRSDAAHRRAATIGDAWFPSQASVEVLAAGRARVLALAEAAARPAPRFGVNLFLSVDPDERSARAIIQDGLGHRFRDEAGLFSSSIAGSPATVRDRMRAYMEIGCSAFDLKILPLTLPETLAQLELLAREVLPSIHGR
jgi:alkanesulfonate monooxygenase SsuD/methylene tetrahydromethanopterin reductase-like flavin-dependent oxidoreductase (luciferase family)